MPKLRLEEHMICTWPLIMWAKQLIKIINKSSRIIYVNSDIHQSATSVSYPHSAIGPGRKAIYIVPDDVIRLTLSYYDKDTRELEHLCTKHLFNQGRLLCILES